MRYIQVSIVLNPLYENITDILSYYLGNIGYESFVENEKGLDAYIPQKYFSEGKLREKLDFLSKNLIDIFKDVDIVYEFNLLEEKNWNTEWEKNYFNPLVVSDKCLVKSSFHDVDNHYEYEITIDPKMAFGTGHHQTTYLMLQEILNLDLKNKTVLDIGCGTAVLAVLAAKKGAVNIVAIDFDKWAYLNAKENISLNDISSVDVRLGEIDLVNNESFDFIFANINRNILLQDIKHYANSMNKGAKLIMSGFYLEDVLDLKTECENNNLNYLKTDQKDNWCVITCIKN